MKAKMYNDKYLGELYLWLSVLTEEAPRMTLKLGGQTVLVDAKLIPFDIRWPGVADDLPDRPVEPPEDDLFTLADTEEALSGGSEDDFADADYPEEEDDDESEI
jgi:hypothetical protein